MFGGGDMDDMMSAFFGGGGMGGGGRRRRKGRDVGQAFPVTLEDLYNGRKATIPREKTILCPGCKGTGAKAGSAGGSCQPCRGQGVRVVVRQVGPGMVQQMQVPCDACGGQGMKIAEKDKCKECNMQRVKTVDAPLTVVVERGMEHEQQIPFMGEGDQHPDVEVPGNVVIVLQLLKHDTFKRDGMDLHMKQKLSLAEALCGFQFTITHLDGRKLTVCSQPGEIIKPGQKKCIVGEGMPKWKDPKKFGDLVIEFEVEFPSTLYDEAITTLRTALPPPPALDTNYNPNEAEHCTLSAQPLEDVRREMEKQEDDVDEEEGAGGGGIRCAPQ
jgi:DnaJ family protein A protein 2